MNSAKTITTSEEQIETLMEFISQHPKPAHGGRGMSQVLWQEVANKLNNMHGSVKTWRKWTKCWSDKKFVVRRKAAAAAVAARKNGGVVPTLLQLSNLEEKILSVSSEVFSSGDKHLALRPLSGDSSAADSSAVKLEEADKYFFVTAGPGRNCADQTEEITRNFVVVADAADQPDVSECEAMSQVSAETPAASPTQPHGAHSPSSSPASAREASASPPPNPGPRRRRRRPPKRDNSPLNKHRTQFANLTEQFLRMEEQRLELDRRNSDILETIAGFAGKLIERDHERERIFARALTTVGAGLNLLADVIKNQKQ